MLYFLRKFRAATKSNFTTKRIRIKIVCVNPCLLLISLLLVLKHEVVANRLTISGANRLEITCSGAVMMVK